MALNTCIEIIQKKKNLKEFTSIVDWEENGKKTHTESQLVIQTKENRYNIFKKSKKRKKP